MNILKISIFLLAILGSTEEVFGAEVAPNSSITINVNGGDYVNGDKIIQGVSHEDFDKQKKKHEDLEKRFSEFERRFPSAEKFSEELEVPKQNNLSDQQKEVSRSDYALAKQDYENQDYASAVKKLVNFEYKAPVPSYYIALARAYERLSQFNLAKENYLMAYQVSKDVNDLVGRFYALEGLASITIQVGKSTESVLLLNEALGIAEQLDDVEPKISILNKLAFWVLNHNKPSGVDCIHQLVLSFNAPLLSRYVP